MRKSRRIPLSSWSDRGLHATAGRFVRLIAKGEASRQQEWLLTMLVNEMEFRYSRKGLRGVVPPEGEWWCHGCELCHPELPQVTGQQHLFFVPANDASPQVRLTQDEVQ